MYTDNDPQVGSGLKLTPINSLRKNSMSKFQRPGDVLTTDDVAGYHDSNRNYDEHPARDIGMLEVISVGWSICNSWVGVLSTIAFVMNQGGPPTMIYGLPLIFIMYGCIVCSLGELASVYPSAGGQYHWTSILAPNPWARLLSYTCGLINIFAWIAIAAGVGIIIPQILLAPIIYYDATYVAKAWHTFLIYQASSIVCLVHNIFTLRRSMWIFNFIFALSVATFFVVAVTCLARAPSFQTHQSVWATFTDRTGWGNDGIVFLTGILSPGYMYAGLDGAIHLAEECKNPSVAVPRALLSTWIVGFLTSFTAALACMYSAQDFDAIASTPTGFPIFELFRQAMQSPAASTAILAIMLLAGFAALAGCQQTASRLTWAFARDNGLFGSSRISHIDQKWQVPICALFVNAVVIFVIGCVYLGSSTAFNAFIGTGLILQLISYAFPAALLMLRKRSAQYLPNSRGFKIPAILGWIANAMTVGFSLVCTVFWCLPTVFPLKASNMNYSCAVIGVILVFTSINWLFWARKNYVRPNLEVFEGV